MRSLCITSHLLYDVIVYTIPFTVWGYCVYHPISWIRKLCISFDIRNKVSVYTSNILYTVYNTFCCNTVLYYYSSIHWGFSVCSIKANGVMIFKAQLTDLSSKNLSCRSMVSNSKTLCFPKLNLLTKVELWQEDLIASYLRQGTCSLYITGSIQVELREWEYWVSNLWNHLIL